MNGTVAETPVPNEVFLRTRAGLSAMVSARAAGRILEGALKGSGHSPDDVDLRQMQSALLGPVFQELEGVLPRHGLKRNLERLARSLRSSESHGADAPAEPDAGPLTVASGSVASGSMASGSMASGSVASGSVPNGAAPGPLEPPAPAADGMPTWPETGPGTWPDTPSGGPPGQPALEVVAADYSAPGGELTAAVPRSLDEEGLERLVARFAQLEHVQLVAAIREDGSVAVAVGEGPDLGMLARLSRLALTLLAKGGVLRSLHLGHSQGQLFLFPVGPDLLVVFGNVDLNLGAVTNEFTALALEEEL
jgi:hypothetical protein